MADPILQSNPLARGIADTILQGFNRHFEIFSQITAGAMQRFEKADWLAVQKASHDRVSFYDMRVRETIALIKAHFILPENDMELWRKTRLAYMRLLLEHSQPELAETFYTSIFCRLFPRKYYTNDYIFVRSVISTEYIDSEKVSHFSYYPAQTSLRDILKQIFKNAEFTLPFENFERDLKNIYRAIVKQYPNKSLRKPYLNFQLSVISKPFFRNKGAYIVGNLINGRDELAFALPILNNEKGELYIDALILGEKNLSIVFSYSQAYFMIEHSVPSAITHFLQR